MNKLITKKAIFFTLLLSLLQISQPAFGMEAKKRNVVTTKIDALPYDCFGEIFGFVYDAGNIAQLISVCKCFRDAVNHCKSHQINVCLRPNSMKKILKRIYKNEYEKLFDKKNTNSFFVNNKMVFKIDLSGSDFCNFISRKNEEEKYLKYLKYLKHNTVLHTLLHNLKQNNIKITRVSISPSLCFKRKSRNPKPLHFETEWVHALTEILDFYPELKGLGLISIYYRKYGADDFLTDLDIIYKAVNSYDLFFFEKNKSEKLPPKLKILFAPKLELRLFNEDDPCNVGPQAPVEILKMIKERGSNIIKKLTLFNFDGNIREVCRYLPEGLKALHLGVENLTGKRIENCTLNFKNSGYGNSNLSFGNIETLVLTNIDVDYYEEEGYEYRLKNNIFEIIRKSSNLKKLVLNDCWFTDADFFKKIAESPNFKKLESLHVYIKCPVYDTNLMNLGDHKFCMHKHNKKVLDIIDASDYRGRNNDIERIKRLYNLKKSLYKIADTRNIEIRFGCNCHKEKIVFSPEGTRNEQTYY